MSAKGPMMRNQPSLVITNLNSTGLKSSPKHSHNKSGSASGYSSKRPRQGVSRTRMQSGNQQRTYDSRETKVAISDLHPMMQITTPVAPLPLGLGLAQSAHIPRPLEIVDALSTDVENERFLQHEQQQLQQLHFTSASEPINLAIESTVIKTGAAPQKSKFSGVDSSKISMNKKRKPSTNARRPAMNRTIYKLPSLSQCIEQKILPRSSEYMRQLYSIALKNHENKVPQMAPRQIDLPDMSPTVTGTGNDTFMLSPDLTQANPNEIQETALNLLNAAKVEQAVNQVLNRADTEQDKSNKMPDRSQSLVQLHVKNLQFPFDIQVHGGFSLKKQIDLNLCPTTYSRERSKTAGMENQKERRRPQTAGRVPAPPNIDLFSNKFISQIANQMSSPNLTSNQLAQEMHNTHEVGGATYHGEGAPLLANDSSKSALSHQLPAGQMSKHTGSSAANQFSNLQSQFANVMDPNKAQIVMCVMPQNGQDSKQTTISHQMQDPNAYIQLLNLNEMPVGEDGHQIILDDETTGRMQGSQKKPEDCFSSQLRKSASSRGSRASKSTPSRRHSAIDNASRKTSGYKLTKPDLNSNSLSQREPKNLQQRNGAQFVVQLSGQGLQGVRISSSRQNSNPRENSPSSSRTGGSNRKKKSRNNTKSMMPDVKLSSTHSLKIQMTKTNRKETDRSSCNDTNRLDEHEEVDDSKLRPGKQVAVDQFDPNLRGRSRSIASNQNLEFANDEKARSVYPVQSGAGKKRYSQANEESQAASLQSHSQNLLDAQMRLKQVYQEPSEKQIHRIPLAQGQSNKSLPSGQGHDSQRHQVLLVTDAPNRVRQIVMSQDASLSNMSNPLNNFQFSVEKMQPIKIKSVVFDDKGNYLEYDKNSAGAHLNESISPLPGAISSPSRAHQNNAVMNHQYSPSQRRNSFSHAHPNLVVNDQQKSPREHTSPGDGQASEVCNLHKRFVVTQRIKRQNSQRETSGSRTRLPPRGSQQGTKHSLRGRHMRLQSAQLKHQKQLNKSRCARLASQTNVHVAMVQELFDSQGMLLIDALTNEENCQLIDYTNMPNTTVNNSVPPLALPTDSGTEMQNSRMPSSHRPRHVDLFKQSSSLPYVRYEENQKIINSFSVNNVRANLRGENATKLMQGLEFSDQDYSAQGDAHGQQLAGSISPLMKRKYPTQIHQLPEDDPARPAPITECQMVAAGGQHLQAPQVSTGQDYTSTLQKGQLAEMQILTTTDQKLQASALAQGTLQKTTSVLKKGKKTQPSEQYESPSITLNAEKEEDSAAPDSKEVIQEAEEHSSQHSKIRVNVSSLRKVVQHLSSELPDFTPVEVVPEPEQLLVRKGSQELKKSLIGAPMVHKSGIKSVYEAEEQALKRGIIKAYSGKGDILGGSKRKEQANTDLQHFLMKSKTPKDDSLRISGFSQRKSEQSASQERTRYARSSQKNGNRNQRSIDSSGTLKNNTNTLKEHGNNANSTQKVLADQNGSPISVAQKSSIGINISRISKKKELKERRSSTTPAEKKKQMTLEGHQKKAHENLEAARQLINEARVLKLDTEVVNQQLLELFRGKQDSKNLDKMMKHATQQLGTNSGSPEKKRRGLQIPFTISQPADQDRRKRPTAASIMTQQLSSSSQGGIKDVHVLNIAPSFAPNSPTSTMNNAENVAMRPSITFGLNSHGASTNRASKWELPFFGGVISSRVGDLVDSKSTIKKMVQASERDKRSYDLIRSPASDQNAQHLGVVTDYSKLTAPIIDYNQNIMTVTSHRQRDTKIRKGSFEVGHDGIIQSKPVSSRKSSVKAAKQTKGGRPMTASRYTGSRLQRPAPIITTKPEAMIQTGASDLSSKGYINVPTTGNSPKLRPDSQGTFRNMTTIKEGAEEHLEQPQWAKRQNLKSKFNMLTMAHQARQAQKWLIEFNADRVESNEDRVATAQLQTITQMSPKAAGTISNSTMSPNKNQMGKLGFSKKQVQQNIMLQLRVQKSRDSPRRVLSMPVQEDRNNSGQSQVLQLDYEQQNSDSGHHNSGPISIERHMPATMSSGHNLQQTVISSQEKTMNDASQQVSLNQNNMSPNMEEVMDTHRILNRHQKDALSNASQSQLYDQPMLNKYSNNFQLHQNSSKSLVNSKTIIEKVQDQGYVRRSRAGEKYFSLTQNMINGSQSHRRQSQNQ